MRQVALDKIQQWFDAGEYLQAYNLAKNLARLDQQQSLLNGRVTDGKPQEWIEQIEAIGGHIPEYVGAFCAENGHTEAFKESGKWFAFPPGGAIPVEVANPERRLDAFRVTDRSMAERMTYHHLNWHSQEQTLESMVIRVSSQGSRSDGSSMITIELSVVPPRGRYLISYTSGGTVHEKLLLAVTHSLSTVEIRLEDGEFAPNPGDICSLHPQSSGRSVNNPGIFVNINFDGDSAEMLNHLRQAAEAAALRQIELGVGHQQSPNVCRDRLTLPGRPFVAMPLDIAERSIARLEQQSEDRRKQMLRQEDSHRWATDPMGLMVVFPKFSLWEFGEEVRNFGASLDSVASWIQKISDKLEKR